MAVEAFRRIGELISIRDREGNRPLSPAEKLLAVSTPEEAVFFVDRYTYDFKRNISNPKDEEEFGDQLTRQHLADLIYDLAPERNPEYNLTRAEAVASIELVAEAMDIRFKGVESLDRAADRYVDHVAERVSERRTIDMGSIISKYSRQPRLS